MTIPLPPAAGPEPGQPGHFAHHEWLEESVLALDGKQPPVLSGAVNVSATNTADTSKATITFPTGFFTQNPAVVAQAYGTGFWFACLTALTANSVQVYASRKDGVPSTASITIMWHATQPLNAITDLMEDPDGTTAAATTKKGRKP
jgi:hypothetical protein